MKVFKKILICIMISMLFSCRDNINGNLPTGDETPNTEQTTIIDANNPFIKEDIDLSKYNESMILSNLISFDKVERLYIDCLNQTKEENVSIFDKFSNTQMYKCEKNNELNEFTEEYYFALKDIRKSLKIILECDGNIESFYIGDSGFLYYFLDDFYYKSIEKNNEELISDVLKINYYDIKNISDFIISNEKIEIVYEGNSITVSNANEFLLIIDNIDFILYKDYYIYNFYFEDFINEKCKNGIKINIDGLCINISKDGTIYLNNNDNVYISYNFGINYFDIIVDYLFEEYKYEEYDITELLKFENILSIDVYSKDGYNEIKKYSGPELNDIVNIFSNIKMNKHSKNDGYYEAICDALGEVKIVINNVHTFYVGASGFMYYFAKDGYYMSELSDYSLVKKHINYSFKNVKTVKEHLSTIKLDITAVNIYEYQTNEVIYTIPSEVLNDFISYFSNVELFFIGGVVDKSSSNEIFVDEVYFFKDTLIKGYVIEFVYANNKKNYVNIDLEGRLYYHASNTYMSINNDINYYTVINEYIKN